MVARAVMVVVVVAWGCTNRVIVIVVVMEVVMEVRGYWCRKGCA